MIAAALTALALMTTTPPPSEPRPIPEGYVTLIDVTATIAVAVPEDWSQTVLTPMPTESGAEVPYIAASPDMEAFYGAFDVPGMLFAAFPYVLNPVTYIDQYGLTFGCTTLQVKEYEDPFFVGVVQVGSDCGPKHMTWNMVVANPRNDQAFTAVVQVQAVDPTRVETVLLTFNKAPEGAVPVTAPPTAPPTT